MAYWHRKRLRLPDYDYANNGAYFITICTQNREKLLSEIDTPTDPTEAPNLKLTPMGIVVERYLRTIPGVDHYVIMPNHVHMILLTDGTRNVSSMIRSFKTLVVKQVGTPIWQRSFYDHVIRDAADYQTRWKYIEDNPYKWAADPYYRT